MGQITRTIAIGVPADVVYSAIKETYLSRSEARYGDDLTKWLVLARSLSRDVPNSELAFTGGKWGAKVEERYTFRELQETVTEVNYQMRYSLVFAKSAKESFLLALLALRMLEYGYKSKNG